MHDASNSIQRLELRRKRRLGLMMTFRPEVTEILSTYQLASAICLRSIVTTVKLRFVQAPIGLLFITSKENTCMYQIKLLHNAIKD